MFTLPLELNEADTRILLESAHARGMSVQDYVLDLIRGGATPGKGGACTLNQAVTTALSLSPGIEFFVSSLFPVAAWAGLDAGARKSLGRHFSNWVSENKNSVKFLRKSQDNHRLYARV